MRGHIRKRGSKYSVVLFIGFDELGKKKYKWFSGFDTKKAAEKFMAAKIQEIDTGIYVGSKKETLQVFLQKWMLDKEGQLRKNTVESYQWLINQHIIPKIGHIDITKLKPQHLQQFYTELRTNEKALSNRSIQFAHTILHQALDRAVKWGIVARNVAEAVDAPRPEKRKGSIWTGEQAVYFLQVTEKAEPRYWIGFFLAIMTGMRRGEILGLRWSDLDLEAGYLQVNQTMSLVKGKILFQEPKTDRSKRSVALSTETTEALRKHRSQQLRERLTLGPQYAEHDMVLTRADGSPMSPYTFESAWYRAVERSGLPKIRFHDLRHTHASLLLQQGVHPKIVSERLGHSNISITIDTYSHVLPGLQKQIAEDFGSSLFGTQKRTERSL